MNTALASESMNQTEERTNEGQNTTGTLDILKQDSVQLGVQVTNLNVAIEALINDMLLKPPSKKFKCKEYPLDNSYTTRTKTIIRDVKNIFREIEVYTDQHLEYVQRHNKVKFFDKTHVLLMTMATSADETNYKGLIYQTILMVEHLITLLNLFYECSMEWSENDHMQDDMKQNIYLFLDLIEHQASYIMTLDIFFKKYSPDGTLKEVSNWMSKAGTDARKEKMKKMHKKLSPEATQTGVGCVIS